MVDRVLLRFVKDSHAKFTTGSALLGPRMRRTRVPKHTLIVADSPLVRYVWERHIAAYIRNLCKSLERSIGAQNSQFPHPSTIAPGIALGSGSCFVLPRPSVDSYHLHPCRQ